MGHGSLVQAVTDREKKLLIDSNNEIQELPQLVETYVAFTQI